MSDKWVFTVSSEEYYGVDEEPVDIRLELDEKSIKRVTGVEGEKGAAIFAEQINKALRTFVHCIDIAATSEKMPPSRVSEIITEHLQKAGEQIINEAVIEDLKEETDKVGIQSFDEEQDLPDSDKLN
jgi:CxxC motif-containing protein